jgi:hypothetical protein
VSGIAKSSPSFLSECIHIGNTAEHECIKFVVTGWNAELLHKKTGSELLPWKNSYVFRKIHQTFTFEINELCSVIDITATRKFISWSLPMIFEDNSRPWQDFTVNKINRNTAAMNSDVSQQLSFSGFPRPGYQITISNPQKDSRESENNRKCGDDCFGIVTGKIPKTITVDTEGGRERGNTFLKILATIYLTTDISWLTYQKDRPARPQTKLKSRPR